MTSRLNKVYTSMDTIIHNVDPVDLVFCIEVRIESLFNVLDDRPPRVIIIDKVTKSWCVNHRQTQTNAVFLNIGANRLYRDGFWDDVETGASSFFGRVQRGIEEGIDEGRFPEARFTCPGQNHSSTVIGNDWLRTNNHDVEIETFSNTLAMPLIGQVRKAHVLIQLPPHYVPHIARSLGRSLWVLGAHGLSGDLSAGTDGIVGTFTVRGGGLAIWH